MSTAENPKQSGGASTLLPESSVMVFSEDQETLNAMSALEEDWRFSRVGLFSEIGDVETAITRYKAEASPDLVILQTDTIDEGFTAKLEELAGYCAEGTAAVVIGPVNDVYLYRAMIDMGISDYLVRPVDSAVLGDVIVKTLIERLGVMDSRLIAFVGSKGGVGTTVMAEIAAAASSQFCDQKTVLLDASGGYSTLSVGLGFDPTTTLSEAVKVAADQDEDGLARMLFDVDDKFSVLAGGGDVMLESDISADQFEALIDLLMMKYPVVIVDLSNSPRLLQKTVLARANDIVMVTTPSVIALRQARSLAQEIKDLRGGEAQDISLLINMDGQSSKHEVNKKHIEDAMEMPVSGMVTFTPDAFQSHESQGQLLIGDPAGEKIVKNAILPILERFLSVSSDRDTGPDTQPSGLLGRFLKKLSSQ